MKTTRLLIATILLAASAAAALTFPAGTGTGPAASDRDDAGGEGKGEGNGPETWNETIASFDGTPIMTTVFRPGGATGDDPVPVVLHSHGWSGTRTTGPSGIVGHLVEAGFGVISIDARGHGESGGEAHVHHRDVEVKDFQAVLDYAFTQDWILKDDPGVHPNNVVAGAVGGSYGGGYQLMTASFDPRLNALVPEMTWNDLTYSLAPNDALKTVWVVALYGAAKATGTRVIDQIDEWFVEGMATNRLPDAAYAHFLGSSPEPQDIRAHVLLQQSFMDTLFNVNEGLENHRALSENAGEEGYEVALFTYLGGHVTPTGGFPWQDPGSLDSSPCGDMTEITLAWLDRHLRGMEVDPPAPVAFALETGDCIEREETTPDSVLDIQVSGPLAAPQGAGSLVLPLLTVEEETVIAGAPGLSFKATGLDDTILHASLAVVAGPSGPHVINHQIAGLRFDADLYGTSQTFDMNAVATKLLPGDVLALRLDAANEQYVLTGNRMPGGVLLEDLVVTLPVIDA